MRGLEVRLFVASILVIAMAVAWLVPFVSILQLGTHTVQEPNTTVLILELIFFVLILGFGIHCFIYMLKRGVSR